MSGVLDQTAYKVRVASGRGNILKELEKKDKHDVAVLHDVEGEHGVTGNWG